MRKAMGKKKTQLMEQLREKFVEGAVRQDYDRSFAEDLFEKLARFAEYGFNRSHSAAYGEITYQTAYLKAHFPREFYAAFLTLKSGNRDRIRKIARALQEEGHRLRSPDVNRSDQSFRVEGDAVRFGLGAVKHVGTELAETIVRERQNNEYQDLDDFLSRIPPNELSAKTFQSLAAGGCFSEITNRPRGSLIEEAEDLVERGSNLYAETESGQSTLFERDSGSSMESTETEWDDRRLRKAEREALGVVLSRP